MPDDVLKPLWKVKVTAMQILLLFILNYDETYQYAAAITAPTAEMIRDNGTLSQVCSVHLYLRARFSKVKSTRPSTDRSSAWLQVKF